MLKNNRRFLFCFGFLMIYCVLVCVWQDFNLANINTEHLSLILSRIEKWLGYDKNETIVSSFETVLERTPNATESKVSSEKIKIPPASSSFTAIPSGGSGTEHKAQQAVKVATSHAAANSEEKHGLPQDKTNQTRHLTTYTSMKTSGPVQYFRCANPIGRLGNLMFQLAATIGIAHTLGYKPYITKSHTLNTYFDTGLVLDIKVTNEMSFNDKQCRNRTWLYNKKYESHNLTAWGYLQSWKYFEKSIEEVRRAFSFKSRYLQKARKFLRVNSKPGQVLVGMHIRRGDFTSRFFSGRGYTVADGNYTRKAMEWQRSKFKNVLFVVVSDDKKWCRDNIKGNDVIFSNATEAIIDLAIMSLCNHCIITGGSFGWWGGWLANGTVIYLKDFPRPGSQLDKKMDLRQNYYPPGWIGMSNEFD